MRIYRNKCDSCGNLFWGNHSADLANRHKDSGLCVRALCRFAKNYESTTAITSIVIRIANQIANFSSLRDLAIAKSWQSKKLRTKYGI